MPGAQMIILGSLVAVVIVQVINRKWGAFCGMGWCLAALGWGLFMFEKPNVQFSFFGQPVSKPVFVAILVGLFLYNGWQFSRLLKSGR
jgi:hypothetical protein